MKKITFCILLLFFAATLITFQSCRQDDIVSPIDTTVIPVDTTKIFSNTYGSNLSDLVTGVQQTNDNGVIVCGYTISTAFGDNDIFIIRYDGSGNILWSNLYGGSGNDQATYMEKCGDGGFIVTGHTTSFSGTFDPFTIKINASGTIEWTRYYTWWNEDYANNVIQTSDGGFILTGYSNSFGSGGYDVYTLKLDQSGGIMWARCFGGVENDFGNAIVQNADGGYVVGGYTFSFGVMGDALIMKLYGDGVKIWSKNYGGIGLDNVKNIKKATSGYIACGTTSSFGLVDEDAYVFNIDNQDGFVYWSRTFDGNAGGPSGFSKVFQPVDGGYMLAGYMQNELKNSTDAVLIKLYGDGEFDYGKLFGGVSNDQATSLAYKQDGGILLAGTTSSFGAGSNDIYLLSLYNNATGCGPDNPFTPLAGTPTTEVFTADVIEMNINYETITPAWNVAVFSVTPNTQCIQAPKSNQVTKY